jgi:hypothetical protein
MKTDKSTMYESLLLDSNTVAVSAKTSQETIDESVVACNDLFLPGPSTFTYSIEPSAKITQYFHSTLEPYRSRIMEQAFGPVQPGSKPNKRWTNPKNLTF